MSYPMLEAFGLDSFEIAEDGKTIQFRYEADDGEWYFKDVTKDQLAQLGRELLQLSRDMAE